MRRHETPELSKIAIGQRFSNLKELCEFVGIKYVDSTNSRRRIEKDLARYLEWERDGNAYIIIKVKPIPDFIPFEKNDLFSQDVMTVLSAYFTLHTESALFSKTELARLCGFVNSSYGTTREPFVVDTLVNRGVTREQAVYFYNGIKDRVTSYCLEHLKGSLASIEDRGGIETSSEYYVRQTVPLPNSNTNEAEDPALVSLWRNATEKEKKALALTPAKYRESKGIKHIGSYEQRKFARYKKKVLDYFSITESREFLRISNSALKTFASEEAAEYAYQNAITRINEKVVEYFRKKAGDDLEMSRERYYDKVLLSHYGIDVNDPATWSNASHINIPPQYRDGTQSLNDRLTIVDLLISIGGHRPSLAEAIRHGVLISDLNPITIEENLSEEELALALEEAACCRVLANRLEKH